MPLDPFFSERFHLLEGISSFDDAFADPDKTARLWEFLREENDYVPPEVKTHDRTVPSPAGDFRIRIYEPPAEIRGVIVWVHGGGFTGGAIDMPEGDFVSRELCSRASVVAVSVEYALAGGGVGYPTLHRQVRAAYEWARESASAWGVAPAEVVLGGASAGANLTLGAVAELVDDGSPVPARLVLAYPTAHRATRSNEEVESLTRELPPMFRFTPTAVEAMYAAYANGANPTPYLSMDGRSLAGFPPLEIVVDEYDDLRTSGEDLAEQARREGIPVRLRLAAGMMHGHFNRNASVPQVDADLTWVADILAGRTV